MSTSSATHASETSEAESNTCCSPDPHPGEVSDLDFTPHPKVIAPATERIAS
jgi:hypothetical protein